jgi:hypothetical protein
MKKYTLLVFTTIAFVASNLLAQSIDQASILFDHFENKSKAPQYNVRLLEENLKGALRNLHQSFSVVDRDGYELIKKERLKDKQSKAGATQQGVTIGAEYLISGEVTQWGTGSKRVERKEKYTPPATKENPHPQELERIVYYYECSVAMNFHIRLIDIETGAVKFEKTVGSTQQSDIKDRQVPSDIFKAHQNIYLGLVNSLAFQLKPELIYALNPKYYILEVSKGGSKAKKVVLTGGRRAGFPGFGEVYLNVYEGITETVDGQKLLREVLIGNVKAEDIYDEVTEALVIRGGEEIAAKLKAGANLFCKFEKIPVNGEFY